MPGEDSAANQNNAFPQSRWKHDWLLALLLIGFTLLAYQQIWRAGFVWDDDIMLTDNRVMQAPDGLRAIWFSTELPDYFPVTSTALWMQWKIWGANPLGYHLVNVLLHALSAVMLWRVLIKLNVAGAWLAAAIFALHPVNVESVAWISEHKNTVAMFFFTLTLFSYLRFEETKRWAWYGAACCAFILALLSKTAVAPLPVVLLGIAWWQRGKIATRDVWRSVPFFVCAGTLALVTIWFQHHRAIGSTVVRIDDFWSRLAGAGAAVWFYFYKALLPINLMFVYPRWQISPGNLLWYTPDLLALAAFATCWRYRITWGKAWLFALGYFVIMLLPVLGFLNISFMRYSLVADRWQYFAILGPIALIAAGIAKGFAHYDTKPLLRLSACFALLCVFGVLTWRQSAMYTNLETLWQTTIAKNPTCVVAHTDLGNTLFKQGRTQEAIAHFETALSIQPNYEVAHYNFGYALLQTGRRSEATVHFETVLGLQPDFVPAHYHLGNIMLQEGNVDGAITHFEKALAIQPRYPHALNDLGVAFIQQGKESEALDCFQKALTMEPDFTEAHNNLGKLLFLRGQVSEAIVHYRASLALQPNDPNTLTNLAWALATCPDPSLRDEAEAMKLAQRALPIAEAQGDASLIEAINTLLARKTK